jgi:hypothetical protein
MAHDSDADSESLAADADADATPKHNANANALRAMPSFKKKSEKVYEEGEFVAAANKAADHADARAFFKEVNDPTKLTAERTHAITRELRKQQEEEEEIEWAEERKHAEQLVDRQKKSRDAASFFAAAPSIRDKMFSRVKSEGDSILATLAFNAATPTPTKSSSLR